MALVLDTCTLLWSCSEPGRLSAVAREAIGRERARNGLVIPVISIWEIAKLVEKGKLRFSIPCREWIDAAIRTEGVVVHPLTPEICLASTELPGQFQGDPADQIIVATARVLSVPVVTSDRKIRGYVHVTTIW